MRKRILSNRNDARALAFDQTNTERGNQTKARYVYRQGHINLVSSRSVELLYTDQSSLSLYGSKVVCVSTSLHHSCRRVVTLYPVGIVGGLCTYPFGFSSLFFASFGRARLEPESTEPAGEDHLQPSTLIHPRPPQSSSTSSQYVPTPSNSLFEINLWSSRSRTLLLVLVHT